jgi:putative ATPase
MTEARPLAERIRPRSISEFIGQDHLGQRLQAVLQSHRPPSLLFFGPPGCGKSTLALLLAESFRRPYLRVSAPETGLSSLRKKLSSIQVLVLDEIHRFTKTQQDFFLPLLESGDLVLLASTTENPSFSVTNQLLSRLNVFRLRALNPEELLRVGRKGMHELGMSMPDEGLRYLVGICQGDARTLCNLLEHASELPLKSRDPEGLRQGLPEVMLRGDRTGDTHYELASALIKSIRGSDPDAALYYLAALLEGGEDPRFVCRRLILSASEDVGLADPHALPLAVSCFQAVDTVGMPEGFIPMAETVVYLALAPKSNSAYAGYLAAQEEIRKHGPQPVPMHLRNPSTKLQKQWGYGSEYRYPHAYPGAWVDQGYLPESVRNRLFYQPKDQGAEPELIRWLRSRRTDWPSGR